MYNIQKEDTKIPAYAVMNQKSIRINEIKKVDTGYFNRVKQAYRPHKIDNMRGIEGIVEVNKWIRDVKEEINAYIDIKKFWTKEKRKWKELQEEWKLIRKVWPNNEKSEEWNEMFRHAGKILADFGIKGTKDNDNIAVHRPLPRKRLSSAKKQLRWEI